MFGKNRTARIVTNSSYDVFASALLDRLKWPSINENITGERVSMVYKSINYLVTSHLSNLFTKNSSRDIMRLRNADTALYVPQSLAQKMEKVFCY